MTVITRFAPSPTGYLHIGGARTAMFNWLFAKNRGGKFLLRIEDTDKARSTQEAIDKIYQGLEWLGLGWDDEVLLQSSRADRHKQVAEQLLAKGRAYYCFTTPEELASIKESQKQANQPQRYPGIWRDKSPSDAPSGVKPVIRLKAPQDGDNIITDIVQGEVRVANGQLDDMVLLRSDGTPTYMLAVVVDDHDMGITHVIRGDDHLSNMFRQYQLYQACEWAVPHFAHIPLIHGSDGAKLSKRHGALGVEAYQDMGYLPEAMRNYLLRLGWSHGNDEIISTEQAIAWFTLEQIGRSPSRFDFDKLKNLNAHYLKEAEDSRLVDLVRPWLGNFDETALSGLKQGMASLKTRAKTLRDISDAAALYGLKRPLAYDEIRANILKDTLTYLQDMLESLETLPQWQRGDLEQVARAFALSHDIKLGLVAQPLRVAITGSDVSPPIFEVMEIIGKTECLGRLQDVIALFK